MKLANGVPLTEAKVVMLGATTVGKTSTLIRLTRKTFSANSASTIGAAYQTYTTNSEDNPVKMQIWDTSGSERYKSMIPMYFRNADAAIVVFDITSSISFNEIEYWVRELHDKGPSQIVMALVGNKIDLEKQRVVTQDSAKALAKRLGFAVYQETSALSGAGITEVFDDVGKAIVDMRLCKPVLVDKGDVVIDQRDNVKKSCHC